MSPSRSPYELGVEGKQEGVYVNTHPYWERGRRFSSMVAWKMFNGAALLYQARQNQSLSCVEGQQRVRAEKKIKF